MIPCGGGRHQISILPEFDQRCVPYAVIDAKARGGRIELEEEQKVCSKLPGSAAAGVLKYRLWARSRSSPP